MVDEEVLPGSQKHFSESEIIHNSEQLEVADQLRAVIYNSH